MVYALCEAFDEIRAFNSIVKLAKGKKRDSACDLSMPENIHSTSKKGGDGMNFISISLLSLRVVLILSVFGLTPMAALNAQNLESNPPQKELIAPNLEPFVGAYKEISQIHSTYQERIIQAEDPTKSEALQEEANQKMTQAVADHGLTITDYNTIFQSIQNDPALKEEFMTVLNRTQ
ncbi:MAG: DUF4168 domain-containing protein [Nitrospira sp.]|nr:DUF4168 domain-containing protein [Nitrospira sp.]HNP30445.1 DUF4168 domain-containing protein [Nitrospirales bacterium]